MGGVEWSRWSEGHLQKKMVEIDMSDNCRNDNCSIFLFVVTTLREDRVEIFQHKFVCSALPSSWAWIIYLG